MSRAAGRREEAKRATRQALLTAARERFARQGFQGTTVREIAGDVGVTERTFYRYFDGKEGLLAEESLDWLARVCDAIAARPGGEPPLLAVERAVRAVLRERAGARPGSPIWLFGARPRPFEVLQRSAPRPLLRFERAFAEALVPRSASPEQAELAARVAVATLRTVLIRGRRAEAPDSPQRLEAMLADAFGQLRALAAE